MPATNPSTADAAVKAALVFSRVVKRYRNQEVLSGVDLVVNPGEFFGLVGVNGAGKTTLIKSMLNFSGIDEGEIRIFGKPHVRTRSRTRLGFLPERFTPPYYLKGRDFLAFIGRLHGLPFDPDRVSGVLTALDLDRTALDKPVRAFSKGMAQKLGLAGCLLSGKDLLVLDEPMSGLDPRARTLLKTHLLELKKHGLGLFFSTHLLTDVEALCDRMGILHQGALAFVGTPAECCEQFSASTLEQAFLNCITG